MVRFRNILISIFLFLLPVLGCAHSGRTDAQGGHWNRKTGTYHYHAKGKYQSCGQVVRVIDGDTLDIMICGVKVRVRLLKIDAPEINTPEGRKAKEYVIELVEGKLACLAHDNIRGYYGRLLADVYVDGEDIAPKIQSFISR